MSRFDRFMVHVDVGTDEKLASLSSAERLCHIAGVLAVAAKSPVRGRLLVGNHEATPREIAKRADVSVRVARSTMDKLIDVGVLTRDDDLDCWRVHNWDEWQVEPRADANGARRQALHRNVDLRTAIRARDQGLCRYCAVEVQWNDRRGPQGGTYDHINPRGGNEAENLVVACRACNSRKCDRSAEQAGMTLLAPPTPDLGFSTPELDPDLGFSTPEEERENEEEKEGAAASPVGGGSSVSAHEAAGVAAADTDQGQEEGTPVGLHPAFAEVMTILEATRSQRPGVVVNDFAVNSALMAHRKVDAVSAAHTAAARIAEGTSNTDVATVPLRWALRDAADGGQPSGQRKGGPPAVASGRGSSAALSRAMQRDREQAEMRRRRAEQAEAGR